MGKLYMGMQFVLLYKSTITIFLQLFESKLYNSQALRLSRTLQLCFTKCLLRRIKDITTLVTSLYEQNSTIFLTYNNFFTENVPNYTNQYL